MKSRNAALLTTILFLWATVSIPSLVFAGPGRTGAQILTLGGGTRAAALGDAFSAVEGDITAAFWNPSGLGIMGEKQAAISYTDYSQLFGEVSDGLYYGLFAGASPIGNLGTLAMTLQLQGQGTILVTADSPDVIREEKLGTNWAWTVAYAEQLTKGFFAGLSAKIISMKLGGESGRAFAVDFGLQYELPKIPTPIRIGAAVQNWGTRIALKDENQSDPLPRTLRVGTVATLYEEGSHHIRLFGDLTAFIDKLKEEDDVGVEAYLTEYPDVTRDELLADRGVGIHAFGWRRLQKSIGAEYWLGQFLALRFGYKDTPSIGSSRFTDHFTYGFGVRLLNYQFDYALVPGGGPDNKRRNVFMLRLQQSGGR
jgi:hypothetical protein